MFELPDSKRVRREDLYGLGNDDDHEAAAVGAEVGLSADAENELRSRLNAQFSGLFDFGPALSSSTAVDVDTAATAVPAQAQVAEDDAAPAAAEDPDELTFEFRLFRDEAPTHTVVIQRNEDRPGAQGEGGFVVPKRPNSYYLAAAPGTALMEQLRLTAVSPEFLLADARRNRWGLEKPWRVTHISITGRPLSRKSATLSSSSSTSSETRAAAAGGDDELAEEKRKRPGKKRRIILRTREKARKEKAEAAKKLLESKEEQLKAKKKRLNREKKLKRRAKEKEKKGAVAGTSEKGETEMADDVSDDGSDD